MNETDLLIQSLMIYLAVLTRALYTTDGQTDGNTTTLYDTKEI